eukprot:6451959-Amphidinium_carterae.1
MSLALSTVPENNELPWQPYETWLHYLPFWSELPSSPMVSLLELTCNILLGGGELWGLAGAKVLRKGSKIGLSIAIQSLRPIHRLGGLGDDRKATKPEESK